MIEVYEMPDTGRLLVKYPCEFFTYKNEWDKIKEELNLTDEELREKISQCLQVWAWADILEDVRAAVEYDRTVESAKE